MLHKYGTNKQIGRPLRVLVDKYPGTEQWEVCVEVYSAAPGQHGYTAYVFAALDGCQQLTLMNAKPNIDISEAAASEDVDLPSPTSSAGSGRRMKLH